MSASYNIQFPVAIINDVPDIREFQDGVKNLKEYLTALYGQPKMVVVAGGEQFEWKNAAIGYITLLSGKKKGEGDSPVYAASVMYSKIPIADVFKEYKKRAAGK